MEADARVRGSKLKVRFRGHLDLNESDVLRFYPQISGFLNEINAKGWSYRIYGVEGEALVEVDIENAKFKLHYYHPRVERFEEEGRYAIEAEIGPEEPNIIRILDVSGFKVSIGTKHAWCAASVDPMKGEITSISGVLGWFKREGEPSRLKEAREVYEVVKWLVKDKGLKFKDRYVEESYKELVDMFEGTYKFNVSLELTVENEDEVPSWDELCKDLMRFFKERGMLMKLKEGKPFGKRPIP
ncbi:MAG: hypothetical protein DRO05_06045 [Thermoproteota archaeon]|nr:MAG: hypothetical protein DRO05_06045 [Candidatus Korarchaeota archaeon]